MQILQSESPNKARLAAETVPQAIAVDLSPEMLAAAYGLSGRVFDWRGLAGAGTLRVDNPAAACLNGPRTEQAFDDSRAQLQSGAPGQLVIEPDHRPDPRLLMPRGFTLLTGQQWARTGALPLHSAAFEIDGRGILALGSRGAGKSVLSMAVLTAGGRLVSDDWVLLAADEQGRPTAERLREFFMLRRGWAAEQLFARLPTLPFVAGAGTKTHFRLTRRDDPRFPIACRIDEVWLLERPRAGRIGPTRWQTLSPTQALACLIESSIGLLFGRDFPHERRAALTTLKQLLARVTCHRVATGTDMIENTRKTLDARLGDGAEAPSSGC